MRGQGTLHLAKHWKCSRFSPFSMAAYMVLHYAAVGLKGICIELIAPSHVVGLFFKYTLLTALL